MKRANLKLIPGGGKPAPVKARPVAFGFVYPRYRLNQVNHCPGCDRSQWWVFRLTAQCAFCDTALPIVGDGRLPEDEQ